MKPSDFEWTRRDFLKGTGCVALGMALGMPSALGQSTDAAPKSRVVLVRDAQAVGADGTTNGKVIQSMLDQAVTRLLDNDDPVACWTQLVSPDDVVGIKSNEWNPIRTPPEVEQALVARVMDAGVSPEQIAVEDRGVLGHPIFEKATALINARPMRTHAWSGVGSLIKNYIMFSPEPPRYHPNTCADLGALWELPLVKGKTRLNVLVMLTPMFHGRGYHHFDPTYVWQYGGLLVGTDPVAVDTIGLEIIRAKRRDYFEDDRPLKPPAHHIAIADKKYGLGTSDLDKIELIKLGWEDGRLI